jgi:hypothetical protein
VGGAEREGLTCVECATAAAATAAD